MELASILVTPLTTMKSYKLLLTCIPNFWPNLTEGLKEPTGKVTNKPTEPRCALKNNGLSSEPKSPPLVATY